MLLRLPQSLDKSTYNGSDGLGTAQLYVLCTRLAPLSHPSEPFLSHFGGGPNSVAHLSFHTPSSNRLPPSWVRGRCKSTRSPTSSDEPTHDSLALGWQDWVLSGLWSPPPKGVPRFGLKRSFQSLLLDGTWNPGQKFSILFALPCQGQSTTRPTELAISARLRELPSLNSVTWRKARHSIGCDLKKKPLSAPSRPPGASFRMLHSTVSRRMYSLLDYVLLSPAEIFLSSPSTPFQHIPTYLFDLVLLTQTSRGPNSRQTRWYQCISERQTRSQGEFV